MLLSLGFTNVKLQPSSKGKIHVTFNHSLKQLNSHSFSVLANLKRVVDSSKRSQAVQSLETTIKTNELIGTHFLNIVPSILSSAIDLSSLTYLQLRDALEILAITIYKHSLPNHLAELVVSALHSISNLLIKNISYDNRLLILLIFTSFLRREERSASTPILLNQILITIQAISLHNDDGFTTQATTFLELAFQLFFLKGLSVLLFKVSFDF